MLCSEEGRCSCEQDLELIDIVGLSYRVGGKTILRHLDLHIDSGETVAVMGMSGSGKSTLLKCLAGLIRPTVGQVLIDGQNISRIPESELNNIRIKMGMVFQYAALFDSMTVYENVAFGLRRHTKLKEDEIREKVADKLALVGLPKTEHMYPAELSGGMQKRVGLARALAMDPQVLYYDEPTSGLDPITASAIDELIVRMRDNLGVTSVVVSHDVKGVMRVANRIAMLHGGKIITVGTPEEIRNTDNQIVKQFIEGDTEGPIRVTG
jgi:phospholipid/cholesterol/gamma-HCH transport system ATP-binding protein